MQWTWVGGVAGADSEGVYSSLGVTSSYNTPGARAWSVAWSAGGAFWLFGGGGFDGAGQLGNLNDLWKLRPAR
ncbi:MAG: hypothetical protein JO002_13465 [Burkholderiaceae bacterium]|nr:hypothetical protein [Burkholderiaceae bacterium]